MIRLMGSFNKHTPIEVEEAHDDSCKISFAVKGHDVVEALPGLRALSLSCQDPAAISQYVQQNMIVVLVSPTMSRLLC